MKSVRKPTTKEENEGKNWLESNKIKNKKLKNIKKLQQKKRRKRAGWSPMVQCLDF